MTPMEPTDPMHQPGLFERPMFAVGACVFGAGDPTWLGPHHCAGCATEVDRAVAQMAEARQRGAYDADGYTPAERRAMARRVA